MYCLCIQFKDLLHHALMAVSQSRVSRLMELTSFLVVMEEVIILQHQSILHLQTHLDLLDEKTPLSVMGMGPLGAAARPLMARSGSLLNYGYLGATPTAPDQWPAGLLKQTLSL